MQILSIQMKNIKSHRDLQLTFSPGINVLSGPNGVGKSTVFEAVGYALFGVDASSFVGNVERFLTIGAKKGEVAVIFQPAPDGDIFRATRTVATPARWLLAREVGGGFEVEEHKDIRETEARLKELLGLDNGRTLAEQFELVIGPFQNEFLGPFVIPQATKRRDKFDEILGIDAWRKTFNETKSLMSTLGAKIRELEAAIGPLQEQVAALSDKVVAHQNATDSLEQTQKELARQQQVLKELVEELTATDLREEAIKALRVEIDKLNERTENGKVRIASQKALIDEAEKAKQIVLENTVKKQAYEKAEKRLRELREQEKLRRQLEKEIADLNNQTGKLVERHAAELRAIEQARQELQNEDKSLSDRRKSLVVDEVVQKLALRLPDLRAAINAVRAQTGALEGQRVNLTEGSEKLAEGICPFFQEPCLNIAEKPPGDAFSTKFAELEKVQQRLAGELARLEAEEAAAIKADKHLNAVAAQLEELDAQVEKLSAKRRNNEERTTGLAGLQTELAETQQKLAGRQQGLKAHEQLSADIEATEAEIKAHQAARDLYVANQEQAGKLGERQAELHSFEQLLATLHQEQAGKENDLKAVGKEYDADRHRSLRERKDSLGKENAALGEKVEGLKKEVARLAGEVDSLKQIEGEITEKKAQVRKYGEKENLVKFLRNRVFRNVSGSLSERFREEISQRANRIYRTIADADEELFWGDDYRIVLRDMVDGELRERTDDQLSGGQTMSAVVALRLAMLQTIGARIAFFDEPTSNLDATRRENLAHAFRAIDVGKEEVTEHWYDQLFLISHDVAFTEVTDQIIALDG